MLLGTVPQSLFFPVLYLERLFEFFNEILTYRIEDVQHNKGLIANTDITMGNICWNTIEIPFLHNSLLIANVQRSFAIVDHPNLFMAAEARTEYLS